MFKNYLNSAIRSLLKNKVYGAISIFGLSIGLLCCFLISLYVYDELSFDKFFKHSDRVYRVALERKYPTNSRFFGSSPVNLAQTITESFPEVEAAGRLHRLFFQDQIKVSVGDRSFVEKKYLFADENFFKVFSYDFIYGDANTALINPNSVVISESVARKYYGTDQALNKLFSIDTAEYIISGVIKDVPKNSHIYFDLLGSIHSLQFLEQAAETNSWISPWLYTYIKLKEGTNPKDLEAKFPTMVRDYGLASILRELGMNEKDYPTSGHDFIYFLQPLEDIHLKSNLDVEVQTNSDITYVYLLSAVVVFILIISCINFINLATARSAERAKEVGVRKVLGTTRLLLIKQFLTESNLIAFTALLISGAFLWFLLPFFNNLVAKEFTLTSILNPIVIIGLLGFVILVGTIAGLYPSFIISSINSATVLKGNYKTSGKGVWLRNFLIIFQFFISITMIAGTLLLNDQMKYMRNKMLGFDKENILIVDQAFVLGERREVFKNELRKIEGVESIGSAFAMPGDFIGNFIANSEDPETPQVRTFTNTIDVDYVPTLNLEILEGRNFSLDFNDSTNILVNETAAKLLGYENPVGKKVINPNPQPNQPPFLTIVGLIKDFHHQSLHTRIQPMLFFGAQNEGQFLPKMAIKLKLDHSPLAIGAIEKIWNSTVDDEPFTYYFLDNNLQNLYQSDIQSGKIFSLFTIVAIIMACLGLFGLASYTTHQRTKEIGIRKVLGASVISIILLLSKDFTKLIVLAFLISLPFVYYGITLWLENFAYHTGINLVTLVIAGLFTLMLAWLTISYYSIKIAILNPVLSLKNE
ncbi:MAG TPA: ABC transporter permease [Cyclobacteriaceae bacterium]